MLKENVNGFKYNIHVIDLLDLILLIDEIVTSQELSEIYEFMTSGISTTIGIYKGSVKKYYHSEPDEITPFTAAAFIDYCSVEPIDKQQFLEELRILAERINILDRDTTRLFLSKALEVYEYKGYQRTNLIVDEEIVANRLRIGKADAYKDMRILFGEKLADPDSWDYDGVFLLRYYDSVGTELLSRIFDFCHEYERSLKKLILEVDFSVLD